MIVSYAQNFEDIMLWRALGDIRSGFYIDAGAASPTDGSVTKLFYENGWRGINIEPNPAYFQQIEKDRHRDINLQMGLGEIPTEMLLHEIAETGLSTFVAEVADEHRARGYSVHERRVQVTTLKEIWREFVKGDVHFLKIDVEGFEAPLIRGNDWNSNRPWIVIVESTRPLTQIECFAEWEPILTDAGYRFMYFDGLNRYYLAEEHASLANCFSTPPNVFDDFKLATQLDAELAMASCRKRIADLEAQCAAMEKTLERNFLVRRPKFLRPSR